MADKEQDEDRYVVIIARHRGMGEFRSTRTYGAKEAEDLVGEFRDAFRDMTLSAYRERV